MLKTIDIVLIAVMISAAAYTYTVKHEAELIEDEIAKVERKIALERETIALLEADWSLLDQPDRLQRLAAAFEADLKLSPVESHQIVSAAAVPMKPVEPVSDIDKVIADFAETASTHVVR
ncbi:hypothetical protein [Aurantimonas sp. Leaf443]|uniref:cell division protein FtsL n=1 Tax=Aurantimonas sp. Leaf443 TaxID=1736378 RepID=UPI0006F52BBF|nr:hypothetical protein [Aurantimonas sp. Leaf443]KQT88337.1 hypothetical protein ASG48_02620 [Aurantimonas sp. Leaf443]